MLTSQHLSGPLENRITLVHAAFPPAKGNWERRRQKMSCEPCQSIFGLWQMVSYCGHLSEDLHTSHGPIMIALFRCQMCSPQLKCDLGIEVKCTISTHASKSRPIFYGPETPPPLPPSTHARLQHPPPLPPTLRIVPGPGCCPLGKDR